MATDNALLLKHYYQLAKNIASLSHDQAKVEETEEDSRDSLDTIRVSITPDSGPYRGGKFVFELDTSDGYPTCPPRVYAITRMYHPNVELAGPEDEEDGAVCLNLLDDLWTSSMTLEDVVQGLLFLMHNPNLDDPLSSIFIGTEKEEEFLRMVRFSLRGGSVASVEFERNILDGYNSECEDDVDDKVEEEVEKEKSKEDAPSNQGNLGSTGDSASVMTNLTHGIIRHALGVIVETNEAGELVEQETVESTAKSQTTVSLPSPPLSSSLLPTREPSPNGNALFSQLNTAPLFPFDKMWTLSLNSISRTIVLGTQKLQPLTRLDSLEFDVH